MSTKVDEARMRAALEDLDPASRALLELSIGRGMSDRDLAEVLGGDPRMVAARRAEVIERIADDLGVRGDSAAEQALEEDLRAALSSSGAPGARGRGAPRRVGERRSPDRRTPMVDRRRTPPRVGLRQVPAPQRSPSTERPAEGGPPPWLARAQAAALARNRAADANGAGEAPEDEARASEIERLRAERGEPKPLLQKGELSARRVRGLWRFGVVAAVALVFVVLAFIVLGGGGDQPASGPAAGGGSTAAEPAPGAPERRPSGPPQAAERPPPARPPSRPRAPRPPIPAEGAEVTMTRPGAAPGGAGPSGTVRLSRQLGRTRLRVSLEGLPNPKGRYELWLYDSRRRAVSVTSFPTPLAVVDTVLEEDPRRYRYVDLSVEPPNGNPGHSVQSVLRAPVSELLEPQS